MKITKGVVGAIYEDDWMPVDKFGERADIWIDMNSPVARNNPGQLYEVGMNRISEFVRRRVKEINLTSGTEDAFKTLVEWFNDVNPDYSRRVLEVTNTTKLKKALVTDAIETGPKLWVRPFEKTLTPSKEDTWNALRNIKKWAIKWGVESSPITYKTPQGNGEVKEFTTIAHFSIGSKYIIHLHKIPEITAPGPASVNHMGIPVKATYATKHFPVSTSPYRYGEDELRVISMDTDIREVIRLQNLMSNSPTGAAKAISTILLSETPTRIKRIPISNGDLLRTSAVLKLFHSVTATLGMETKSTKVENFEVPDYLTDAIWDSMNDFQTKNPDSEDSDDDYLDNDGPMVGKKDMARDAKMKKILASYGDEDEEEEDA